MKKYLLFLLLFLGSHFLWAQSITITFTGLDAANNRVQLDSVTVIDVTKGVSETVIGPDSVLTMQINTGIADQTNDGGFALMQNNPNPFNGITDVNLAVADAGALLLEITDVNGRLVVSHRASPRQGIHKFRITLSAAGIYVLTARQNGKSSSVKMVNNGGGNGEGIEYVGVVDARLNAYLQPKAITTNSFDLGDWMEYVGYATINGTQCESEHVSQELEDSQTVVLCFTETQDPQYGVPCPGMPTLTDIDGNVYNTVKIGNQCWMKENLRTTHYADNTAIPAGSTYNSTTPYRYAPDNNESNVGAYGYLYNWPAVMHGASSSTANPSGVQGICPNGWHVPSDAEWSQLTDYVGNQSEYVCDGNTSNIAKALAATTGWSIDDDCDYDCAVGNIPSANNATGFSALPAGSYGDYDYDNFGFGTLYWSATEQDSENAWFRSLQCDFASVFRYYDYKYSGFSVRCVRNEGGGGGSTTSIPTVNTEIVFNIGTNSATCYGNVMSDGGESVTQRGVCWSLSQNPTINSNVTLDGEGTGIFSSLISGLAPNTTYYVCAYATNIIGTAYGEVLTFTTAAEILQDGQPCSGLSTLTDVDGNSYNTVQIGNQCWMKENLRTTRYADGVAIPQGNSLAWSSSSPYFYDLLFFGYGLAELGISSADYASYGYYYNWPAVVRGNAGSSSNPSGIQGVCPDGWHVPSSAEWSQLRNYVSGKPQYCCNGNPAYIAKALASSSGWIIHDYEMEWEPCHNPCSIGNYVYANNATGFSATPAGGCDVGTIVETNTEEILPDGMTMASIFWSATPTIGFSMDACLPDAEINNEDYYEMRQSAFSVRCLRD